jgi:hypothetical protein
MCCFGETVKRARTWALDSAVCVLEGLRDLVADHPALRPEVVALTALYDAWDQLTAEPPADLSPRDREAHARFAAAFEPIRAHEIKIDEAIDQARDVLELVRFHPQMQRQVEALARLCAAWSTFVASPVLDRFARQ